MSGKTAPEGAAAFRLLNSAEHIEVASATGRLKAIGRSSHAHTSARTLATGNGWALAPEGSSGIQIAPLDAPDSHANPAILSIGAVDRSSARAVNSRG